MAAGAKVPVSEAYTNDGTAPADRAAAGMSPAPGDTAGNYGSAVRISNGRIEVEFGVNAHPDIFGQTLSLTPYETGTNSIVWRCGSAAAPPGNLLVGGEDHQAPTIDARYLPSSCRN